VNRASVLAFVVFVGLASVVSGCGGGGSDNTGSSSGSPAVAAKHTISGRVSYSGTALDSHKILVTVNRQGDSGPPAYSTALTKVGAYTIGNVVDGTYTILAFIDLGNDMGAPQANEPVGTYDANGDGTADFVIVKNGEPAKGIDIVLKDR
jgi:hypothetical protein